MFICTVRTATGRGGGAEAEDFQGGRAPPRAPPVPAPEAGHGQARAPGGRLPLRAARLPATGQLGGLTNQPANALYKLPLCEAT